MNNLFFLRLISVMFLICNFISYNSILSKSYSKVYPKSYTDSCSKRKVENVTFYALKDSESNERVARDGILVLRPNAKATVLVLHGYTRDKCDASPLRLLLKNFNIFSFDFRAHGEHSAGQLSTMGYDEVYDVFAAVDYLRSRPELKNKPIFVMAFSMGSATAIEAQSLDQNLFAGMFLDTPFHSSAQVIKNGISRMRFNLFGYEFGIPGKKILECYAFNSYIQPILRQLLKLMVAFDGTKIETFMKPISPFESISKINIPCYFVVCVNDKVVPYQDVKQIYENHPGTAKLFISEGRGHCDALFNDPEYYDDILNSFFDDIVSGTLDPNKRIIRSCA